MCKFEDSASDEALAARAGKGCRDCFSRLYQRFHPSFARYLHESFSVDFDSALDIEAEAWRRAFEHVETYGGDRPFRAWMLTITRNLALNRLRHDRRTPRFELLARSAPPASSPVEALERRETLDACVRLVRSLSMELREPFVLRVLFDLDVRSVAQLLGTSLGTARGRLFRARKALVDAMKEARR